MDLTVDFDTTVATVEDHGTIVVFTATDGARFGVDHRTAQDLIGAVMQHGTVNVNVDDWQILGRPR